MPLREPFKDLVAAAYDQRAGELKQEIERLIEQMKADGVQAADRVYDTLTGSEHGPYLQRIRDTYSSTLANMLTQAPVTPTRPNINGNVWPTIDDLMEHTYSGEAKIVELVNATMSRLGTTSGKHRSGIRGAIGRFHGQHGYGIRENETNQKILYTLQQTP